MKKDKSKINFGLIFFMFLAIVFVIIDLFPFAWSMYGSLRPTKEVYNFTLAFGNLSFDAYKNIWRQFPISTWYINSIVVATVVTLGNVIVNSMAGYALARLEFPFKNAIYMLILSVMMIPGQVVMIPTFMMINKLGWTNSYIGLTIPFLFSAFNTFMMRQFFLSFPKELEEAAKVDGMTPLGIFFRIALPLAKAPINTLIILSFMGNWNSFLYPSLLTTQMNKYTLPVGLSLLQGQHFAFPDQVMAGAMLLTIPMVIVYLVFQRKFIEGLTDSAVKG
jgi:multiple sugar transport system permease protein